MNLHLVPTLRKKCGIAEFAKGLNPHLEFDMQDSVVVSPEIVLLEHEYAYDGDCWEQIEVIRPRTFIYMHSANITNPNNALTHRRINDYCEGVIVSTNAMKNILSSVIKVPVHVVPHYSEPIVQIDGGRYESHLAHRIGLHGFAVPRTCLIRAIMELNNNAIASLHIVSTVNDVTNKHLYISRNYLDRCRSVCRQHGLEDRVTFDFEYYEKKSDIARVLADHCDLILLAQASGGDTYNASGTARVALSSGVPVVVPDYPQFSELPDGVVYRMKDNYRDSIREVIQDPRKAIEHVDKDKVMQYTEETSPQRTAAKIKEIMCL
jgi:hypothetical protein